VRIFKNKAFMRFAKKAGIGDARLCESIRDAERGLIAADLGGGVIKLVALKLASELLAYDDEALARVVASGALMEVICDEKAIP